MVLPPYLFPPPSWFIAGARHGKIVVGMGGNYEKQTLRSRYTIAGPNNLQDLIVPVVHTGAKKLLTETRIARAEKWDKMHVRAMNSVYGKAPFFEFYDYRILPLLSNTELGLADLIREGIAVLHKNMIPEIPLEFTSDIAPDIELPAIAPYYQVFEDKCGFRPGVSALDLLFNLGPEAGDYIRNQAAF